MAHCNVHLVLPTGLDCMLKRAMSQQSQIFAETLRIIFITNNQNNLIDTESIPLAEAQPQARLWEMKPGFSTSPSLPPKKLLLQS